MIRARSSMRSKASLLLLLLLALPGLLLPAGTVWHRCGCAQLLVERSGCCAHATPRATCERPPARACCKAGNDLERSPTPTLQADRCGCSWLPLAEDQPTPTPPESLPLPPSPLLACAAAFELPPLRAPRANRLPERGAATTRPPPPDHHRTLPLRL